MGGIAEQSDLATLPSVPSSRRDDTVYISGAAVAFIVAAAGAAGWYVRRKRAV